MFKAKVILAGLVMSLVCSGHAEASGVMPIVGKALPSSLVKMVRNTSSGIRTFEQGFLWTYENMPTLVVLYANSANPRRGQLYEVLRSTMMRQEAHANRMYEMSKRNPLLAYEAGALHRYMQERLLGLATSAPKQIVRAADRYEFVIVSPVDTEALRVLEDTPTGSGLLVIDPGIERNMAAELGIDPYKTWVLKYSHGVLKEYVDLSDQDVNQGASGRQRMLGSMEVD